MNGWMNSESGQRTAPLHTDLRCTGPSYTSTCLDHRLHLLLLHDGHIVQGLLQGLLQLLDVIQEALLLGGLLGAAGVEPPPAVRLAAADSTEVGEVGEPPVHSCSTVMFFRLCRIFRASRSSLKPRGGPSLLGLSDAPSAAARPRVVPGWSNKYATC